MPCIENHLYDVVTYLSEYPTRQNAWTQRTYNSIAVHDSLEAMSNCKQSYVLLELAA